jgi:hypothetical protein
MGNESPLASIFQKQQAVNDLNEAREACNAILEKGKQLGLEEAAHTERKRHTCHCRVRYGRCNSGCNSTKTKCEPRTTHTQELSTEVLLLTSTLYCCVFQCSLSVFVRERDRERNRESV